MITMAKLCMVHESTHGARKPPGPIKNLSFSYLFLYYAKQPFTIFQLFTASVRSRPPGPPAVPGVFFSFPHFILAYFGPGGLRAPCVLACAMRSLAIVITIVQSFSPLLHLFFSPSFAFDPLRGIYRV